MGASANRVCGSVRGSCQARQFPEKNEPGLAASLVTPPDSVPIGGGAFEYRTSIEEFHELIRRQRLAEEEALTDVAAELREIVALPLVLHPFGDEFLAQGFGEGNDGLYHRARIGGALEVVNEGLVDLDCLEGQAPQVPEG